MSATTGQPGYNWAALTPPPAVVTEAPDETFAADLLAHMDAQLVSARRMQQIVLEQASAIRRRAVRQVVTAAGELQVEMHRRELLERDRMVLMQRASRHLAVAPDSIGFTSVQRLLDSESAQIAKRLTDELMALLKQIDREHKLNRVLMTQELAFLDHLLSLAGGAGGYVARPGSRGTGGTGVGPDSPRIRRNSNAVRRRVFDLEA